MKTEARTYFGLNNWPVINQNRGILPPDMTEKCEKIYLPYLIMLWQEIEKVTGHRWKTTSYWRDSPSHSQGVSLDIAPDVSDSSSSSYAVSRMSDPVLYKREALIRALQRLPSVIPRHVPYLLGVFIEPDHLHLQILKRESVMDHIRIVKWGIVKPVYGDSLERSKLPLIKSTNQ